MRSASQQPGMCNICLKSFPKQKLLTCIWQIVPLIEIIFELGVTTGAVLAFACTLFQKLQQRAFGLAQATDTQLLILGGAMNFSTGGMWTHFYIGEGMISFWFFEPALQSGVTNS